MSLFSFYDVIVSSDGDGDFRSVQQAIENAPQDDSEYVIFIRKGVYQESFEITRPNVVLIGEDRDQTIITASVANGMLDSSGRKFATFGSRTISVNAADFSATSLTIANGFDFPGNQKSLMMIQPNLPIHRLLLCWLPIRETGFSYIMCVWKVITIPYTCMPDELIFISH